MSKDNVKLFSKPLYSTMDEKQKRVIAKYKSASKLRSVMRWRERMARGHITAQQISKDIGISYPRISEYINFKSEPPEKRFLAIESAIYKRGA